VMNIIAGANSLKMISSHKILDQFVPFYYYWLGSKNLQERVCALNFFLEHKRKFLMHVVVDYKGSLWYRGLLQNEMDDVLLNYLKKGHFLLDKKELADIKGARLVVGRDVVPAVDEYKQMIVPNNAWN